MRSSIKIMTAAAVCAAVLAGNTVAADAATSNRATVRVHGNSKHAVIAPGELRPGVVHIRNTGEEPIYIFKGKQHATAAELAKLLSGPEDAAGAVGKFSIVDFLMGHRDTYLRLTHGTYFLLDPLTEHVSAAKIGTVRVAGAVRNAKLPKTRPLTVDKHNRLHVPATAPDHSWLHLRNFDGHEQYLAVLKIGSGTSDAALADFIDAPTEQKAEALDVVGSDPAQEISAHHDGFYHLGAKGRYVIVTLALTKKAPDDLFAKNRVRLLTVR